MQLLLDFKITRGQGSAEGGSARLPLLSGPTVEPRLLLPCHHWRQLSTRVSYPISTSLSRPYRSNWSLGYIRDGIIGGGLATACARGADGSPVAWAVEYNDGRCAKGY